MDMTAFALTMGAAFFWGLSLDIVKLCAGRMNALTFNTVQYSVLAVLLTPVILVIGVEVGSVWAITMAAFYGVSWLFIGGQVFYYCLECAPAHVVVPISNISAVWGVIFAALLLNEVISPMIPISLAFIVIGIILLAPRNGGKKVPTSAIILSVSLAVMFGLNQIARKSAITDGISPLTFVWISSLAGSSLLFLTGLLKSSFKTRELSRSNIGISVTAGLLNQLVGSILYLSALSLEKVSNLSPVTSAVIPFGFLLSLPLLRERPTKKSALGVMLMFLGVVIATL